MATLKISDLSVGDWVRWKVYDKTYDTCISQITDILIQGVHDGIEYGMKITQLSPIPITAEILEKSGFERSESPFAVYYHADKVWISYDKLSETWSVTININNVAPNLYAKILYIHQLQHALRLAGLDKEINL